MNKFPLHEIIARSDLDHCNSTTRIPELLENCFIQDRKNEACWDFLQEIIVRSQLGGGYTVNLADTQGIIRAGYMYSRPRSFFYYGGMDESLLEEYSDRRVRVKQAVKKIPEVTDDLFDTREDEIKANMYQFRGRWVPRGYATKINVHTLACSWKASALVPEKPLVFQKMKVYLCFDWDSGLANIPAPVRDDNQLYLTLECGKDVINTAFECWLARNSDIPLIREIREQMVPQYRQHFL